MAVKVCPMFDQMGKQDSSWRRVNSASVVRCLVLVIVLGQCVGGKQMSETLQRALSAVRGPSPGAKKLLNIPEDGVVVVMDQPTTSTAMDEGQHLEPENIGLETTKMLKRMIWKLKLDQKSTTKSIPLSDPVARTARYTGMNKVNVEKILAFGESLKFEHIEMDRQIIQKQLMSIYFVKNHIPTITELFNSLDDKLPIYVDLDYFTKILIKMGYVFYKFPRRKALRVMEKKSVMFERYKYLKSIQQYRKDNVPIAYVGLASIDCRNDLLNLERTLQTDTKNILSHILFTATGKAIENIKVIPAATYEELKDTVKDWLSEIFALQNLPSQTVCVLEDSKIFRETLIDVPTWKSVKADMVQWLEENNIPCHIDMPKADLLQLIETCTDAKDNTFVVDYLVKIHNYSMLRLPQCISGLSIVAIVVRFLNDKKYFKNLYNRTNPGAILSSMPAADLKIFSNCIQLEEKQQLEDDINLDNVLDELVRNMKMLKIDVEDKEDDLTLPTFSDSE